MTRHAMTDSGRICASMRRHTQTETDETPRGVMGDEERRTTLTESSDALQVPLAARVFKAAGDEERETLSSRDVRAIAQEGR